MYAEYNFYALQDRGIREQELAKWMAESRRRALTASRGHFLRARMARRLLALAVAADSQETWKTVWEGFEAKGRL